DGVLRVADKAGGAGQRAPRLPCALREDATMTTLRSMLMGTAVVAGPVAVTAAAIRHPAPSRGSGGPPALELTNTSWLNADRPLRLAELRGRVVLLNFWVFTCGNCTRPVPSL